MQNVVLVILFVLLPLCFAGEGPLPPKVFEIKKQVEAIADLSNVTKECADLIKRESNENDEDCPECSEEASICYYKNKKEIVSMRYEYDASGSVDCEARSVQYIYNKGKLIYARYIPPSPGVTCVEVPDEYYFDNDKLIYSTKSDDPIFLKEKGTFILECSKKWHEGCDNILFP